MTKEMAKEAKADTSKARAVSRLAKAEAKRVENKAARVKEEKKKRGVKLVERTVEIPDGITVSCNEGNFVIKGPKGQLTRNFPSYAKVTVNGSKITFSSEGDRKRTAISGTLASHARNMIVGVTKGYEGHMKVVHSHFPMKVTAEGTTLVIQNFLGERRSKRVECMGDIKIRVDKDTIIFTGIDKEAVGQTMARVEETVKVKGFDRRIFQDGIYITHKPVPEGSIA